ncbi:MAG: DUF4406 domain-containing protein [Methanobacterium paludis]|nr:DUF4406 domain-containing protein [Methanobacterium paludis]
MAPHIPNMNQNELFKSNINSNFSFPFPNGYGHTRKFYKKRYNEKLVKPSEPSDEVPKICDKIYVAGALNSDSCGYIKNLHRMIKLSNKLRRMGNAVFCPGNDFLEGLVDGDFSYKDYANNTLEFMKMCDAVVLTPGWGGSKGTKKEIRVAEDNGIPVLKDLDAVEAFNNRPKILVIVGKSGSGKSTIAEYIQNQYGIRMIQSHTDRPKRDANDTGHTFHSKDEYDMLKADEMIATTTWNGNRYCCLHSDVSEDKNTYVIDEKGLVEMTTNHRSKYKVFKLYVQRDIHNRVHDVGLDRVLRDNGKFWLPTEYYDKVIYNNNSLSVLLHAQVEDIVESFFY